MSADEERKTADFIVRAQPKVPLRDAPAGKQVAVVPTGTMLHGLVILAENCLWLRIDLAPSNPLRAKKGLAAVYACLDDGSERLLDWDGPMDADLAGNIFKVKWVPPASTDITNASYVVESKADGGGDFAQIWRSSSPGSDDVKEGVIEANMLWPRSKRAVVRITAEIEASGSKPWQLSSTPFTVNADILDMRFLDKGARHLSRLKGALVAAMRAADAAPDERGLMAQAEDSLREILAALDARGLILRRAVHHAPPSKGPVLSKKRVLLGGKAGDEPPVPRRSFQKVLVLGLYHSCTSAMAVELERRFDVSVLENTKASKDHPLWKHRVHHHVLDAVASDVLVVLLVKEPHFWLQSLCRDERNFCEIHPFVENEFGEREDVDGKSMSDLFQPFEHDTIIYPHGPGLWTDVVRSFSDDEIFPPEQCVVVRCEDFLFKFHEVMDELGALGLKERGKSPPEPLAARARPDRACRSRDQALRYYGSAKNWKAGFTQEELEVVGREVDLEALKWLRYNGADPVATWSGKSRAPRGTEAWR